MAVVDNLSLTSAVGLERSPDIVLFNLTLDSGLVKEERCVLDLTAVNRDPDFAVVDSKVSLEQIETKNVLNALV